MSLTFEQFVEARRVRDAMSKRLKKLIGYDPTNSNHYGAVLMYNYRITEKTTDDELLELQSRYLAWRDEVLTFFKGNGYPIDNEEYGRLFDVDIMYGVVSFLGVRLDIEADIEPYRERMLEAVKMLNAGEPLNF